MSLSLTALRAVAAVADQGSVTAAARRLGVTQPALTYQLRRLEAELGGPLFERSRRGMTPTPAGPRLLRAARAVLEEIEHGARDIERIVSGQEGVLRISSECFTTYHWLPEVLTTFRDRFPDVKIEVDVDPSRRPIEAVEHGDLDVALTTVPPTDPQFTLTPLFDDEIVAVMRPDHPLAGRPYLDAEDFADESVLVYSQSQSDVFNLVLQPAGVQPRHTSDVFVTEAIVEMVKAGVGISVMASWIVQPELDAGTLGCVRVTKQGIRRQWTGVTRRSKSTPPYVSHFLTVLGASVPKATPATEAPAARTA